MDSTQLFDTNLIVLEITKRLKEKITNLKVDVQCSCKGSGDIEDYYYLKIIGVTQYPLVFCELQFIDDRLRLKGYGDFTDLTLGDPNCFTEAVEIILTYWERSKLWWTKKEE